MHRFSSVHCQKENYLHETKIFWNIKFKVLGSWADNSINNDMLAHFKLSSDSTKIKIKIKNSHFRYSTVDDFRIIASGIQLPYNIRFTTSGFQPRTITSGLRIRFSTSGSQYPVSSYGLTSGSQSTYYNFRYSITSLNYIQAATCSRYQNISWTQFNVTTNPWKYMEIIKILPFISPEFL